ncbi:MAG: MgtC/SapB family protein [Bacillota bacterium]
MFIEAWEIAVRLLLSVVLGGMIGFERERHNRPAGFRTHILVCSGSTLIMMVSAYGFTGQMGEGFLADPGRIAAGVVTGIGFLGAGTILQQRGSVRGLTTAATIWVVSGVGLAAGVGFYMGAVLTTIFVLISLFLLKKAEAALFARRSLNNLRVRAIDRPGLLGVIGCELGDRMIDIRQTELSGPDKDTKSGEELITIDFLVQLPSGLQLEELFDTLYNFDGIKEVVWRNEVVRGDNAERNAL